MLVHANDVKISIQTAVKFAEKENVKLLYYLVLLGNDSGMEPKKDW